MTADLRACVDRFAERVQDASLRPEGSRPIRIMASTSTARPPEIRGAS